MQAALSLIYLEQGLVYSTTYLSMPALFLILSQQLQEIESVSLNKFEHLQTLRGKFSRFASLQFSISLLEGIHLFQPSTTLLSTQFGWSTLVSAPQVVRHYLYQISILVMVRVWFEYGPLPFLYGDSMRFEEQDFSKLKKIGFSSCL